MILAFKYGAECVRDTWSFQPEFERWKSKETKRREARKLLRDKLVLISLAVIVMILPVVTMYGLLFHLLPLVM
jgi:hypothetical protein